MYDIKTLFLYHNRATLNLTLLYAVLLLYPGAQSVGVTKERNNIGRKQIQVRPHSQGPRQDITVRPQGQGPRQDNTVRTQGPRQDIPARPSGGRNLGGRVGGRRGRRPVRVEEQREEGGTQLIREDQEIRCVFYTDFRF